MEGHFDRKLRFMYIVQTGIEKTINVNAHTPETNSVTKRETNEKLKLTQRSSDNDCTRKLR